jgi:hypothetical protein
LPKTNQLSLCIETSPEGTAENYPGRQSWVNAGPRDDADRQTTKTNLILFAVISVLQDHFLGTE